jgi:hypothetical protein
MPRYVILEHADRQLHWDFMLESGTVLRTWRLHEAPEENLTIAAEKSFDHRLAYLDYEGPLTGGRGAVTRWDKGEFEVEEERNTLLSAILHGNRLRGRVQLERAPSGDWSFRFSSCDD